MQRLRRYFPIFMIALVVQILAPIGANIAFAAAISDPLAAAEICQTGSSKDGNQGGQHQTHDASCVLCCGFSTSAVAFSSPEPTVLATPYRFASVVVWRDDAPQLTASRTGSNAKARAPPSIS